jgi:large subunit ribosomal protein L22
MAVDQALTVLDYMPQKGARMVKKTLTSALANAENNFDLSRYNLYVASIYADGGPMLKRTSHLTIVLAQREGEE